MKIKLYWPNCNYINKKKVDQGIDSYWLECTLVEAEREVYPYLSTKQIEDSRKHWELKQKMHKKNSVINGELYYLVSKDLKSIVSFPWSYPNSNKWGTYCPFQRINEIEIIELREVKSICVKF